MKRAKTVIRVDFEAHRHTDKVLREVLGPSVFRGGANEHERPTDDDNGMLPGMAAWKAAYEAKYGGRRAS